MVKSKPNNWLNFALLASLSLIWGSSFILMKRGLVVYPPSQVASLRILMSGLVMLPYILFHLKEVTRHQLKYILLFCVMNAGIPPFLFATAQMVLPSSTAGVLNALTPLFTLVTGILIYNVRFNMRKLAGVMLGLAGCFIIIFIHAGNNLFAFHGKRELIAGLLLVMACLMYGTSNNINKTHLQQVPAALISGFAYCCMAIPAGVYLFSITDFTHRLSAGGNAFEALAYIFILAALGSALAMVLFSKLVQRTSALFASFITYIIPFVALLWGFLDGETIGMVQFLGLAIIFSGIYIAKK